MEVGQPGRTGKIVTLHVAMDGWFENVTAIILHRHMTAKTVETTTGNIKHVTSTVVVMNIVFCYINNHLDISQWIP